MRNTDYREMIVDRVGVQPGTAACPGCGYRIESGATGVCVVCDVEPAVNRMVFGLSIALALAFIAVLSASLWINGDSWQSVLEEWPALPSFLRTLLPTFASLPLGVR